MKNLTPDELHISFTRLIKDNERIIYKICFMYADNAADRQDLQQEIILQSWKSYKNFRGDAKFSTWLYQVAINTAITGIKKQRKSVVSSTADGLLPDVIEINDDTERADLLHDAIGQLNSIEKALVTLYLDDKNYDEMEAIMGIPNGTLRVKMTRIKEKLKAITLNKRYGTE